MEKDAREKLDRFHDRLKTVELFWAVKDEFTRLAKNLNSLEMAILKFDSDNRYDCESRGVK